VDVSDSGGFSQGLVDIMRETHIYLRGCCPHVGAVCEELALTPLAYFGTIVCPLDCKPLSSSSLFRRLCGVKVEVAWHINNASIQRPTNKVCFKLIQTIPLRLSSLTIDAEWH
jgi:hypothetical protein